MLKESNNFTGRPSYCKMSLEELLFLEHFKVGCNGSFLATYSIMTNSNVVFKKSILLPIAPEMTKDEIHNLMFIETPKRLLKEIIEDDNVFMTDGILGDQTLKNIWIVSSSVVSVYPSIPKIDFYTFDKVNDELKIKIMQDVTRVHSTKEMLNFLPEYIHLRDSSIGSREGQWKVVSVDVTARTLLRLITDDKSDDSYLYSSIVTSINNINDADLRLALAKTMAYYISNKQVKM